MTQKVEVYCFYSFRLSGNMGLSGLSQQPSKAKTAEERPRRLPELSHGKDRALERCVRNVGGERHESAFLFGQIATKTVDICAVRGHIAPYS